MTTKGYGSYTKKKVRVFIYSNLMKIMEKYNTDTGYDIEASTYLAQTEQFLYAAIY